MPAITVEDTLVLPRIPRPDPAVSTPRPVAEVITSHRQVEGGGFTVRRPFPGDLSFAEADPFLLLDHLGPQVNAPGAQVSVPWNPAFSALAYVLTGRGTVGAEGRPVESGQLVVFGPGDHLVVAAADRQAEPLDVLLLGGLPIREPIAHYGPFVMNTREEILQAVDDFQAGRLGVVPADQLAPRNFA